MVTAPSVVEWVQFKVVGVPTWATTASSQSANEVQVYERCIAEEVLQSYNGGWL